MTIIYRGILIDLNTNLPVLGDVIGDTLGVRVPDDVVTTQNNGVPWVSPTNAGLAQGTSVAPDTGCNLPPHRRPKPPSAWNGVNKKADLRIWRLDSAIFQQNQLAYVPDPDDPAHGFISPGVPMSLAAYRALVHGTAASWTLAPDPAPACTNVTLRGGGVSGEDERAALVDATAAGGDVEPLIVALRSANAAGVSRTSIIAELTAGVDRAPDDDSAEVLLGLLDRITGFCGPHARIHLSD